MVSSRHHDSQVVGTCRSNAPEYIPFPCADGEKWREDHGVGVHVILDEQILACPGRV